MSEISMSESPFTRKVDLTTLNLPQLQYVKQQLDKDLEFFKTSVQTLRMAQSKFEDSGSCLHKLDSIKKDNEIFVPLTASVYVAGKLADADHVLVDIGTGYVTQKSVPDAKNYFDRRVSYVSKRIEEIQRRGLDKLLIRDAAMDLIEMKLQSQGQKQGPGRE
ncbi:prefoldin 5 [Nomia melanderi]|uniref:prefoldin 5 n=1 Tax=Nomia melanderi TaxID=2448451 RepID=UPI0013046851|nr:prefoldin subunit 5 [Nomia melanderi]